MDIDDLLNLRRRRDPRPTPQRIDEQLPSRGGIDERGGDDRPTSKRQASESAADVFGRLDSELFASAITGEPTRADRERFDATT